ncbi:hypothetical protein V8D89_010011 [Ganoderma adspersum]
MAELDNPDLIARISYNMLDYRVSTGTIVLVIYEYLITFGAEVQLFWGRDITGASILFFVNRYMRLIYVLFDLRSLNSPFITTAPVYVIRDVIVRAPLTSSNDTRCASYEYTVKILVVLDYIPWVVVEMLLRHPRGNALERLQEPGGRKVARLLEQSLEAMHDVFSIGSHKERVTEILGRVRNGARRGTAFVIGCLGENFWIAWTSARQREAALRGSSRTG